MNQARLFFVLHFLIKASPAVAKDVDIPPSPASKRAHHPDPLRPEQVQELGITGVSKGDCVFLVDKILDERTRNVFVSYCQERSHLIFYVIRVNYNILSNGKDSLRTLE